MSFIVCHAQYDPANPSQRVSHAKQELNNYIQELKHHLPSRKDDITYLSNIYISKKTGSLVFKYDIDDSDISMDDFDMKLIYNGILTQIENANGPTANLYWDLVVLKKNLVHLYVGSFSKKQKVITVKYEDIRYMRKLANWL